MDQGGAAADRPLALVYRGPAALPGCPESVAALLRGSPSRFRTLYVGPHERHAVTPRTLARAELYAQPGGGSLGPAWRHMRRHADAIRGFVADGGTYLGFCVGGYLAGHTPGFGLIPGDTDGYVGSRGAEVDTTDDTVVTLRWRGQRRHLFFQDGAYFHLRPGAQATVLARYRNGLIAALVAAYHDGRVGVVGPHPEADASWYTRGLRNPDGVRLDLGRDLVEAAHRG
jgi:glutamine amidotransferase-like uncharacterized protein